MSFTQSNIIYTITSGSTVSITGNTLSVNTNVNYLTETVTNASVTYIVTSIGNNAFSNSQYLTGIIVPNSVTSIGEDAFYGSSTFYGCSNLSSAILPTNSLFITINSYLFAYCYSLPTVIIPNSVTTINPYAFFNSSISSITVPSSAVDLKTYSFIEMNSLTNLVVNVYSANFGLAFWGLNNAGLHITFDYIGHVPFNACHNRPLMTSVTFGNQITAIDEYAFNLCTSLNSITITNSVQSIASTVFGNCTQMFNPVLPYQTTIYTDSLPGQYVYNYFLPPGTNAKGFYLNYSIINTNTVTYNGNGNDGGSVPIDKLSPYNDGATVTVLDNTGNLTKTHYIFYNWNTAANGSGVGFFPGDTFAIIADTVLYAQWVQIYNRESYKRVGGSNSYGQFYYGKYGFMYKKNTGVGGRRSTKFAPGGNITCNSPTYLYNKYKPGGSGIGASSVANRRAKNRLATVCLSKRNSCFPCYSSLGQYSSYTHNPNGFVPCIVAEFIVRYFKNSFFAVGFQDDFQSPYKNGSFVTVKNQGTIVRSGYSFVNWNTEPNGSGTTYVPNEVFMIDSNIFLYAQWELAPTLYHITYNGNGNTSGVPPFDTLSPYIYDSTVTVLGNTGSLAKTGFVFSGWNTAADGSGTNYAPTATFIITTDVILYAKWV